MLYGEKIKNVFWSRLTTFLEKIFNIYKKKLVYTPCVQRLTHCSCMSKKFLWWKTENLTTLNPSTKNIGRWELTLQGKISPNRIIKNLTRHLRKNAVNYRYKTKSTKVRTEPESNHRRFTPKIQHSQKRWQNPDAIKRSSRERRILGMRRNNSGNRRYNARENNGT